MEIRHIEIEVNVDEPFKNCKLDRAKYATVLTEIVGNYKNGFVLAINNEWGTGKTTFVKMWRQQLNLKGYKTLYFNSWENDFDASPLVAIISELNSLTDKKTAKVFKSLVEKGAVLTKSVLPKLLKAIASKYVDIDEVGEILEKTTEGVTEILDKEIKDYSEKKKSLKEFKINLEKFVKESSNEKPIIFIIDELDRCRPNYAVEVLEQVKHFFSVPNIVFVLAINKIQLGHAIRGVYGSDRINADEYLRRFIDVEYSIPEPNTKDFCNYLCDYFEFDAFFYSQKRGLLEAFRHDKDSFIEIASTLFEKSNISLRQQEKVFGHARLGLRFFKENAYLFPSLYVTLVFLRYFQYDFYSKMKSKLFTPQELITEFENLMPKGINHGRRNGFIYMEAILLLLYNNYLGENKINKLVETDEKTKEEYSIVKSGIDVITDNKAFTHALKIALQEWDFRGTPLNYLLNKIDLTDNISL